MNYIINEKTLLSVINNREFYEEMYNFLMSVIDEELLKSDDEIDCDLIQECTDIIVELNKEEDNSFAVLIPFISSQKLMEKFSRNNGCKRLGKGARAVIIAAVVACIVFSANAAVAAVSGVNLIENLSDAVHNTLVEWGVIKSDGIDVIEGEDDDSDEVIAEQTTIVKPSETTTEKSDSDNQTSVTQTKSENDINVNDENNVPASKPSQSEEITVGSEPKSLRLEFSNDFKREYLWGEELNTRGLKVIAVYVNNTSKSVSVDDCSINGYNKAVLGNQKIVVKYKSVSAAFDINVSKTDSDEKVITGVIATPPKKQVYTAEDKEIDLKGLCVKAVYSDGTYSQNYNYKDAVVKTKVDFSEIGIKDITLRIADLFDYTYSITIIQAQSKDDEIEYIDAGIFSRWGFYVGQKLEDSDFYIAVHYKSNKEKHLKYSDYKDEIEILNFDTSYETFDSEKVFTACYKGFTINVPYCVKSKMPILSAQIKPVIANLVYERPKFLYYQGEDLGYGKGKNYFDIIESLKSSNVTAKGINEAALRGVNWIIQLRYAGTYVTKDVYPDECDFCGYDPYKIGFQNIDVFYDGNYLLSYNVFVYGDDGLCPAGDVQNTVRIGYEDEDLPNNLYWCECLGNGELSNAKRYPQIKAVMNDNCEAGRQNVYIEMPNGENYTYTVNYVYEIEKATVIDKKGLYEINIKDLSTENFDNAAVRATLSDSTTVVLPLLDFNMYYHYWTRDTTAHQLNEYSDIKSAFSTAVFYQNTSKQKFSGKVTLDCFVYADGYEKSYCFNVGYMDGIPNDKVFDTDDNEFDLLRISEAYIDAYNNKVDISVYDDLSVEGVEWGVPGKYTAVFKTEMFGMTFTQTKEIIIVEKE